MTAFLQTNRGMLNVDRIAYTRREKHQDSWKNFAYTDDGEKYEFYNSATMTQFVPMPSGWKILTSGLTDSNEVEIYTEELMFWGVSMDGDYHPVTNATFFTSGYEEYAIQTPEGRITIPEIANFDTLDDLKAYLKERNEKDALRK